MLPLDQVKIDAMFLHEAGRGGRADAIVRALVGLAHGLGLETVAEGVESRLAWEPVGDLGCDLAQGFYLGHPMPAPRFSEWLTGSWPVVGAHLVGHACSENELSGRRGERHDRPDGQQRQRDEKRRCERDVSDVVDRRREHRVPEGGRQEPDDGG